MQSSRHSQRRRWIRVLRGTAQRHGTAATEFAICIPLLILMALACADFGRIAYFHQVVCNAARTGAETGATQKVTQFTRIAWEDHIYQATLTEMQNIPNFNAGELNYDLSTTTDSDDLSRITIVLSYPFRTVVNWPGLPSEVLLHKQVEFRQFR